MRMVIISLIILLAMLGLWGWFYYGSVEPVTTYYRDNLSVMIGIINSEDWDMARKDIKKYTDKWNEIRKTWMFFINQRDIDNINSSMKQVNIYIENKDKILAQAELEHLIVLFNVINENECLSLENIF